MSSDLPPASDSAAAGGAGPARVRKRGGRLMPFDLGAIRRALLRLTEGVDPRGGDWVQSWLEALQAELRRRDEKILSTAEIHRLVYEIIVASGQAQLADRWFQYAARKQRLRARIAAAPPRLPGLEADRDRTDRPTAFVRGEWLQRFVAAGIDPEAAEALSRDLAQAVLQLEADVLTTGVIAALARSLCLTRGICALPADLPLSGVTPAELDQAYLAGDPAIAPTAAGQPAPALGAAAQGREQWALERFYPEEVRFFHRLGYWRLGLTEHPWGPWALRVDAHRVAVEASRQPSPEAAGLRLAQILTGLCRFTAETVTVQAVGEFIQRSQAQETLRQAMLRAFTIALAALLSEQRSAPAGAGWNGRPPARLVLRLGTPQHVAADEALLKQMSDLGFDHFAGGLELELPPRALTRLLFQKSLFAAWTAGVPVRLTAARPAERFCLAPVGIRLNLAGAAESAAAGEPAAARAAQVDWAHEFFDTNADDLLWALEAHRRHLNGVLPPAGLAAAPLAGNRFTQWAGALGVLPYFQAQMEWQLAVTPVGLSDPLADPAADGRGWDAALWDKLLTLPAKLAAWQGGGAPADGARPRQRRFVAQLWPEDCTGFAAGWQPHETATAYSFADSSLERLPGLLRRYAERAARIDQPAPLNLLAHEADARMALEDGRTVLEALCDPWTDATVRLLSPAMAAAEQRLDGGRPRFGRLYDLEPLRLAITQPSATPRLF